MLWTLSLLRSEIWQHLGEPSDLDPDTDTQYEGGPLLDLVANEAQVEIASWRDPVTQRRARMPNLDSELYFQSVLVSGTLEDDAPADNQITLPAGDVGDQADRYNGWVIEDTTTNEKRLVVDYAGYTATVHEDWDTNPSSGDSYKLYKRFSLLTDSDDTWQSDHIVVPSPSNRYRQTGNLIGVLEVEDVEEKKVLSRAPREASYLSKLTDSGDPGEFMKKGNRLIFDYNIDEEKWFKMVYSRMPTAMSNDDDYPEIPEQFHYGIVLWGVWWGRRRDGESARAYSAKRDLTDFMRQRIYTEERENDYRTSYGSLQKE